MKPYILSLLLITMVICMQSSCTKFLTKSFDTDLKKQEVIHSYDNSRQLLTNLYGRLSTSFAAADGSRIEAATDNAEFVQEGSSIQWFNQGTWNAYNNPDNVWSKYYEAIRATNRFLQNVDSINLDEYRVDPGESAQIVYKERLKEIKRWAYEARFLRCFFYFQLVKRYGGVPLILTTFSLNDGSDNVERSSLEECIRFIVDECDSAAAHLPLNYDADLGRATKGAAMALKSIALLYAASDLFNDPSWAGGYGHPELISLSGNRSDKWEAAAEAAKEVIDSTSVVYTLSGDYSNLFNSTSYRDKEMIFVRRNAASNSFEKINFPIGFDLAEGGMNPSQNLIDAYEMIDGTKFDWNNPEEAAYPYENRDPRMAKTIITDRSTFSNRIIEIWQGGKDGRPKLNATKTGYYLKKYVDENMDLVRGNTSVHTWIFIRLAEIYLNYAEALNEWTPGDANIEKYINKVRFRAGMPDVDLTGLSQEEVREIIRHEDRIEFAFEGHRFWNVRRWMKAEKYFNDDLEGVRVKRDGFDYTYKKIKIESRTFEPKMYLYPIPQSEINADDRLIQNPLW